MNNSATHVIGSNAMPAAPPGLGCSGCGGAPSISPWRCNKCGVHLCRACTKSHACDPADAARWAERFPVAHAVQWRPLVVLCPSPVPGTWKIVGRAEGEGSVARDLARSEDLASLRQELAERGYRLRDGGIDEHRGRGLEIHERAEGGQA